MENPELEVNIHNVEVSDDAASIEQHSELLNSEPVDETQLKETEVGVENQPATEDGIRRSVRTRRLTEKGQELEEAKCRGLKGRFALAYTELQEAKCRGLKGRFSLAYNRWKALAKESRKEIEGPSASSKILQNLMKKIRCASSDVQLAYEDLRKCITPDGETRRRTDTCDTVSRQILEHACNRLEENEDEEIEWFETGSAFTTTAASKPSSASSSNGSKHSSLSSKKIEAAAELAATEATLRVEKEVEREVKELQKLEADDRQRLAQQEEECAARKHALEEKRRQIERLETMKRMDAAKARLQVYDEQEEDSNSDILGLFNDYKPKQRKVTLDSKSAVKPQTATMAQPATTIHKEDGLTELAKALAESFSVSRLPVPEPAVFSGDPLKYKGWNTSFQTLIGRKNIPANEKIYYLQRYVGGPARKAIEGYFLLSTDAAYQTALDVLERRYGNPFLIAKAFRDKLASWPKMGPKDSIELREFSDFLQSCQAAMSQIESLEVLNDCAENQRMLSKLPDWLTARWNRKVTAIQEATNKFPSFNQFVNLITKEAEIACNPITSLHALKSGEGGREKTQRTRSVGAKVLTSSTEENTEAKGCVFCEKSNHGIHTCRRFMNKTTAERVKFVKENRLCFGCLKAGHHSKNCERRSVCETCKRKHPTCLHEDRFKRNERKEQEDGERKENWKRSKEKMESKEKGEAPEEATSHRVVQNKRNAYTSTVVPVWLSTTSNPEHEVLVYALLDNQSDTTFILQEKADTLDTKKEPVQLKLSTMSSKNTVIQSQRLTGLQVRGFTEAKKVSLPVTYTREFIPANLSHIPTPKTARSWPHLEHLAEEIAPPQTCDIGLLVGYNCSQALLPREVVCGKDDEPFAQRTDLGWSIVGCADPCVDYGDAIGSSHRILVKQVTPHLQSPADHPSEVRYICRTQIKEVFTPPEVIRVLESDFNERTVEDAHISQEDLRFISIMEQEIKLKSDGHCEMPLPFKEERPSLPQNRICADHRLKCLRKRLEKDEQYRKDYKTFMSEMITRGDAEKVPEEQLDKSPAWYIPHHGVYHPHKPGKIRVVFDCSAKFQGVSLNDNLLTGPELTNTLVGVLCRFRKGPVAITCDVERMFHQFHVREEDRDYLRFLWWEDGDLQSEPSVYRMKVHLFGAASSPGCANFGLKHIAAQGQGRFSEASIRFIERNFYVDDGLTSVSTEEEAIQLVTEARQLCSNGKLRIHKFISNRQKVLASIPKEECAETVRNQDFAKGELQLERVLGVEWCVASDQFQFRVVVKERPLSRRGVLSTVASIFDPLGFVAPFILVGKQILQQMCRDKVGWDEPLSDDLRPQWESWLLDLQNLAGVKIQRCYIPDGLKEIQRYELHHFSDASVTGYGECTYLRAIDASGQIHCALVMAKARVAPTKVTTVPRLELSAAVVAVRTSNLLRKKLLWKSSGRTQR